MQVCDGVLGVASGVLRGCGKQGFLVLVNLSTLWGVGVLGGLLLTFGLSLPSAGTPNDDPSSWEPSGEPGPGGGEALPFPPPPSPFGGSGTVVLPGRGVEGLWLGLFSGVAAASAATLVAVARTDWHAEARAARRSTTRHRAPRRAAADAAAAAAFPPPVVPPGGIRPQKEPPYG